MLEPARRLRYLIGVLCSPAVWRREWERWWEFLTFNWRYGDVLRERMNSSYRQGRKALFVSAGISGSISIELALIKALELAGYTPIIITGRDRWFVRYYQLAGVDEILFWHEFAKGLDASEIEAAVTGLRSFNDLLAFEYAGARAGKYAASTALRYLRLGKLDLESPEMGQHLRRYLGSAMVYARAGQEIVRRVQPEIALSVDPGYTPRGELFDACLAAGIDTITWNSAHKSNVLILKRYTRENRNVHPVSVSDESWCQLRSMEWTDSHRRRLQEELYTNYASGDWYSEVGTQFHKHLMEPEELRQTIGLDPSKRTVVIFPHIFWDGTFFWGKDLFGSYEEWFVETVRAACGNDGLNWVIKVHPANVVKNVRDGVQGEPSEVIAIWKHIGPLPRHVCVIPSESEINTFSLFGIMDYCVTVRGTIGIEAASFGIPVLTAGTGRYDRRGFTIDSDSREEYLQRLACIQEIPALSRAQRELAERFAYGIFVLRPLPLTTVTLEFQKDAKASSRTRINARTREDWLNAPDLRAVAHWIGSGREDFLVFNSETERIGFRFDNSD